MSESGKRVLLIEADLRRPRISSYLGLEDALGLTNVLAGQMSVDEALQDWGTDGLKVLSSGSIPPNPSELLGSRAMADFMHSMHDRFDLIVLDTPPLGPVTDAAIASVGRRRRRPRGSGGQDASARHGLLDGVACGGRRAGARHRAQHGPASRSASVNTRPTATATPPRRSRGRKRAGRPRPTRPPLRVDDSDAPVAGAATGRAGWSAPAGARQDQIGGRREWPGTDRRPSDQLQASRETEDLASTASELARPRRTGRRSWTCRRDPCPRVSGTRLPGHGRDRRRSAVALDR